MLTCFFVLSPQFSCRCVKPHCRCHGALAGDLGDAWPMVELPGPAAQISCGRGFCCATLRNASVACWGDNNYLYDDECPVSLEENTAKGGVLGVSEYNVKAQVTVVDLGVAGSNITSVTSSPSSDHVCALSGDGDTLCWGRNDDGQLGLQTTSSGVGSEPNSLGDNLLPVDLSSSDVQKIQSGCYHTCAMTNGNLKCFGGAKDLSAKENPQLGTVPPCYSSKLSYSGSTNKDDCTLLPQGCIYSGAEAGNTGKFESAFEQQFGLKNKLHQANDEDWQDDYADDYCISNPITNQGKKSIGYQPGEMGDKLAPIDFGPDAVVLDFSTGCMHTCVVLQDPDVKKGGVLKCFGFPRFSRIPTYTSMGATLPVVKLGGGHSVMSVSAGLYHTCVVLSNGRAKCFGDNRQRQCGIVNCESNCEDKSTFAPKFVDLCASEAECIGAAYTAADDEVSVTRAVPLGDTVVVTQVAAGGAFTCALTSLGQVTCWGSNEFGQLGHAGGNTASASVPENTAKMEAGLQVADASRPSPDDKLLPENLGGYFQTIVFGYKTACCGHGDVFYSACVCDPGWSGDNCQQSADADATEETCVGSISTAFRQPDCLVTKISAGFESACAVLTCGTGADASTRMQCWGRNNERNLASELTDPKEYKAIGDEMNEVRGRKEIPDVKDVSVGGFGTYQEKPGEKEKVFKAVANTCILTSSTSEAKCFGSGQAGVLLEGATFTQDVTESRTPVRGGKDWSYAEDQQMESKWIDNNRQALTDGVMTVREHMPVVGLGGGKRKPAGIAVGTSFSCALLQQSGIKCWGEGRGNGESKDVGDDQSEVGNALPIISVATCPGGWHMPVDSTENICEPCGAGTFRNKPGHGRPVECTVCPLGHFSTARAAKSIKACRPCKPGFIAAETGMTKCVPCPRGFKQSLEGNWTCDICPSSTYTNSSGSTECLDCPQGTRGTMPGSATCELCPAGFAQEKEGSTDCVKCNNGKFQAEKGKAKCIKCERGKFSKQMSNNSLLTVCLECTPTAFSLPGSSKCIEAQKGMMMERSRIIGVEDAFYTPHLDRLVNMLQETPGTNSKANLTIKEKPANGAFESDGEELNPGSDPVAPGGSSGAQEKDGEAKAADLLYLGYDGGGTRENHLLAGIEGANDDPCAANPDDCLAFPVASEEDGNEDPDRVVYIPRFYQCRTPGACTSYNHSAKMEECEALKNGGNATSKQLEACNQTQIARCKDRRTGVLCGRCMDKYYASGNSCMECPSFAYSVTGFVLIVLLFAFILNVLFKSDAKASKMMTKYKGKRCICSHCMIVLTAPFLL